ASKVIVAYALQLIGPITRGDLDLVRFLRNEFAHSRIPFNFTTPEVRALCDRFRIVDLPGSLIPHGYLNRVPDGDRAAVGNKQHPRTRFSTECHSLRYRMILAKRGPLEGDLALDSPLP